MTFYEELLRAGAMAAVVTDPVDQGRQATDLVKRILAGEMPKPVVVRYRVETNREIAVCWGLGSSEGLLKNRIFNGC